MDKIGASDSELDGLLRLIFFWSAFGSGTSEVGNSPTAFNSPAIVRDTMLLRCDRLALLQTSFPFSHWAILTLLATSIVGAFLFESDQATLQFLDAFQLRALFAALAGALSMHTYMHACKHGGVHAYSSNSITSIARHDYGMYMHMHMHMYITPRNRRALRGTCTCTCTST